MGAGESEEIDESLMHEMEEIVGTEVLKRNSSIILRKRSTQASLTNKQAQAEPVPTKKKLIEEEKAETGSVKLSVFVDYMRTAGLTMTVGAIAFHCISTGVLLNSINTSLVNLLTWVIFNIFMLGCSGLNLFKYLAK